MREMIDSHEISDEKISPWTKIAAASTALELIFAKISIVAVPAVIMDLGAGIGNLLAKSQAGKLTTEDVTGLLSSLSSVGGTFMQLAALGIEKTPIGLRLITLAKLTTVVGVGLFVVGYIIDHHEEILEYSEKGLDILKEQYFAVSENFDSLESSLKEKLGAALFSAIQDNDINYAEIFNYGSDGKLEYNFERLDPKGDVFLKENLKIEPQKLYDFLNGSNLEQQNEILKNLNAELEGAENAEGSLPENGAPLQGAEYLHQISFSLIDMDDSNLELIHFTKDDVRNSPFYTKHYWNGNISYMNPDLPWMEQHAGFVETPDGKFHYFTMLGINKGLSFPVFYDKNTNLPLG